MKKSNIFKLILIFVGKITIFYIILYLCLSAFWTILLVVFYQTLDVHEPKYKQEYSRIGNVPGLGFRPIPPEETIDSTLIWFKHAGNDKKKNHWIENINEFLERMFLILNLYKELY